jgi:hypothetical protein
MATILKSNNAGISFSKENAAAATMEKGFSWKQFWDSVEFNRYGIGTYLLVAMVCMSGWAAAVAVQDPGMVKLLGVAVATTMLEALVLALAPMRLIVSGSLIVLLIDLLVILL